MGGVASKETITTRLDELDKKEQEERTSNAIE